MFCSNLINFKISFVYERFKAFTYEDLIKNKHSKYIKFKFLCVRRTNSLILTHTLVEGFYRNSFDKKILYWRKFIVWIKSDFIEIFKIGIINLESVYTNKS